jgi:hypothetical protein
MNDSSFFSRMDAFMGAMIGSLMAVAIVMGATLLLGEASFAPAWQGIAAGLFFLWCVVAEGWFLLTTWHVVLNKYVPYAVAIALFQPRMPVLLRPIAALWWGYQSPLALVWGIVLCVFERAMPTAVACLVAIVTAAFSSVTFGYLLLAVTAFTKEPATIVRIWNWRGRWALAHGVIAFAAKLVADVF